MFQVQSCAAAGERWMSEGKTPNSVSWSECRCVHVCVWCARLVVAGRRPQALGGPASDRPRTGMSPGGGRTGGADAARQGEERIDGLSRALSYALQALVPVPPASLGQVQTKLN